MRPGCPMASPYLGQIRKHFGLHVCAQKKPLVTSRARIDFHDTHGASIGPLQLLRNQREHILRGVFSDKNIQVPVIREHMQRMVILAPTVEELECPPLALSQKTEIIETCDERKSRRCGRLARHKIRRQLLETLYRNKMPCVQALYHLLEESNRHLRKLLLDPLARFVVQIRMTPQRRKPDAVGETHSLADGVVALVVRQPDQCRDRL